jgi:hypothetical protein
MVDELLAEIEEPSAPRSRPASARRTPSKRAPSRAKSSTKQGGGEQPKKGSRYIPLKDLD